MRRVYEEGEACAWGETGAYGRDRGVTEMNRGNEEKRAYEAVSMRRTAQRCNNDVSAAQRDALADISLECCLAALVDAGLCCSGRAALLPLCSVKWPARRSPQRSP